MMKTGVLRGFLAGMLAVGLLPVGATTPDPGIYAEFNTSMGSFTCQLNYVAAPLAVANFIGLATGERAWRDEETGLVRKEPFYNGQIFHRVIADFMIQGGSPRGDGTDGPGYVFPDEFASALRHDGPGVLSMANSGPRSNGSQFFVTVAPAPHLDDVHTIFGHVVEGQSVVDAINVVATDGAAKPLVDVVLQTVVIRRQGAAAEAFDIDAQGLPEVSSVPLSIRAGAGEISLTFTNRQNADFWLTQSSDFSGWSVEEFGINIEGTVMESLTRTMEGAKSFYSLTQVQYPGSTLAPKTLYGRELALVFDDDQGTITIVFDSEGGATYTYVFPGTVGTYEWYQQAYRGRLLIVYDGNVYPMLLTLNFESAATGSFGGEAYLGGFPVFEVSGTFTLTAP